MTPKLCGARARAADMLVTLSAATCLSSAAACSEHSAVGSVRDAASSHFAAFQRFERWAERSVESDVRLQGEQALRETVFAPLRRDREVVWADVQVDARQVLTYRTPLADAQLHFTPIEAALLGRVQVALCEACDDRARAGSTGAPSGDCVVIARAVGRRPARVRMAFCRREPDTQAAKPALAKPDATKPATSKAATAKPRSVKAKPVSPAVAKADVTK